MFFFLRFLLTGFKISACRSEGHKNSAKDIIFLSRRNVYFIQKISVARESRFEQYTNKKLEKILTNFYFLFFIYLFCFLIKKQKPKDEVFYLKSLAKMK